MSDNWTEIEMGKGGEDTNDSTDDEVIVIVDGGKFVFNGKDLADKSDYFDAMFFKSCMKESFTKQVKLDYISAPVMDVISDYVKGKDPTLNEQNIFSLTTAVTMLQFRDLCEKCCKFLCRIITPQNCLSIMNFSDHQSLLSIYNKAKRTAMWSFLDVIEGEEYSMLTQPELSTYLTNDSINLEHKADAVYAVLKWAWSSSRPHKHSVEDVVSILAIFDLTDDVTVLNDIAQKGEELSKLSLTQIRHKFQTFNERSCCSLKKSFPRVLVIIGGDHLYHDSKQPNTNISYLDKDSQSLKTLTRIPFQEERPACSMGYKCCVVGKDLYITGGEKHRGRNQWCRDVWRYDPFEDVWDVPTELPGPRRHHCVCTDGENLYLIGGFGSYRYVLDKVDVYNVKTDEWSRLPPLPRAEFSATCTCDREQVYVIKSIVQIYSKSSNLWTLISPPLPYNSAVHSLHIFGTKLIMMVEFLHRLIEFDTNSGEAADMLTEFKETCGSGCLVGDVFYMAGGSNVDESSCVEGYNVRTKTVEKIVEFETALANHECVSLPFWSRIP